MIFLRYVIYKKNCNENFINLEKNNQHIKYYVAYVQCFYENFFIYQNCEIRELLKTVFRCAHNI